MEEQTLIPEKTTKLPKWLTTVTPFSKYLALSMLVILPIAGFYLGRFYQSKQMISYVDKPLSNESQEQNYPTPTTVVNKCPKFGIDKDMDNLYDTYTVKEGDTLLSVAKNQLNDVSRVGDIVSINKNKYPGLSVEKPFIEPGYKLYLPPYYLEEVSFYGDNKLNFLYSYNGEITEVLENGMFRMNKDSVNPNSLIRTNNKTIFIGKEKSELKVGDCITAIAEERNMNMLIIMLQ